MILAGFRAVAIAILLTSAIWGQSLEVSVENKVAKTVVRTISQNEFSVGDFNIVTPGAEQVTDPKLQPVVLIRITSPVPQNRVKCRTAPTEELEPGLYMISKPGEHLVEVLSIGLIDGELFWDEKEVTVVVQQGEPDVDPTPGPDIDDEEEDDDNTPDVDPAYPPAPADGFRVLLVYETKDVPNYTPQQLQILQSQRIKKYLDEHTVTGSDGVTPEWRFVDQDSVFADESVPLAKLLQRPRQDLPWIVITSGGFVKYEGPLPDDVQATLDLLATWKGD